MSDALLYTPPGCVLYLDLRKPVGDKLLDYSGHGNIGTIYGARLEYRHPLWGLSFDGVDDYVEVPDSDVLNSDTFTVAALFHPVLPHGNNYTNAVINKALYRAVPNGKGWYLRFYGRNSLKLQFGVYYDDAEVRAEHYVDTSWHFAVAVYDGAYQTLYVDGVVVARVKGGTTYQKPVGVNLRLGRAGALHGYIALAQVYNRVLTADEIKMLYEDVKLRLLRRMQPLDTKMIR